MIEAQDRPLVTFALIAYNQEKFVREAVQGALAQDYNRWRLSCRMIAQRTGLLT